MPTRQQFAWFLLLLSVSSRIHTLSAAEANAPSFQVPPPFVVHEWGTFTVLQDDNGKELPGINIDDEPVPPFVHNLAPYLLNNSVLSNEHWIYRQKGAPRRHLRVTMRLETPVLYFYPSSTGKLPPSIDVDVRFRGGWLTEFYPWARAEMSGMREGSFDFGPLTPDTVGRLTWLDVKLDTHTDGPITNAPVWLAPRQVASVDVTVQNPKAKEGHHAESERYLFYRGVANQRAPLRVATNRDQQALTIRSNFDAVPGTGKWIIGSAWLVDIRGTGQTAFRTLAPMTVTADSQPLVARVSTAFGEADYASDKMDELRRMMHKALVADGLFDDEATAMLATWQRAYFQTAGLRLFFLVPRPWTDHYLPIEISSTPRLKRVMMGRIELITEAQRERLAKIARGPISDGHWINKIPEGKPKDQFLAGRSDFGDLGVKIPVDYQAYLNLGRFRNALVVAEERRNSSPALSKFIQAYGLQPYRWSDE